MASTSALRVSIVAAAAVLLAAFQPCPLFATDDPSSSGVVYTSDNVPIAYDLRSRGSDTLIIICPGFYNSKSNRWMRATVDMVSEKYDTLIFDFRGHGASGGKYTWSAKEDLDVKAIVDYAKTLGYKHIGIVAFSLGAAAALNAAASYDTIDSMVLISCPFSFRMINFHFWEPGMFLDLKDNIESGWQGKGARVTNILLPKRDPIDSIRIIKDTPILFIHGDRDWVIKDTHSGKLFAAARRPKRLEVISGGYHAERLIQAQPDLMKRLVLDWFAETLRWKEHHENRS